MAERRPVALVDGALKELSSSDFLPAANIPEVAAAQIHAATSKPTPADADELGITDSAASWGLKKLTWANLKATLLAYFKGQFREKLTAARTYYVRTDGNDSNTGLVDYAGGAFLTIQKAIDVASAFDLNGFTVSIQLGDGTWTAPVSVGQTINGALEILGNATTPDNVFFSVASGSCVTTTGAGTKVVVRNMKLQAASVSACAAVGASRLTLQNVTLGACGYAHVAAAGRSQIVVSGNCRIVGSAPSFANLDNAVIDFTGASFTLTGTPAFTYFLNVYAMSYARAVAVTFTGSATGSRYSADSNSYINVNAAGESYLPGNAAGTKTNGGQYS